MSKSDRVSPPVDAQADLSARDRAEVDMAEGKFGGCYIVF